MDNYNKIDILLSFFFGIVIGMILFFILTCYF